MPLYLKRFELFPKAIKEMETNGIYQWDDLYPTREDFEEDIKKKALYISLKENKLAAVYVINGESDPEYKSCTWNGSDEKAYFLHRLCVSPDFQHQGVGKEVLSHIEEQLSVMGYESVRLDAFTENPFALKMYEKSGYEKRGYADWRKGRFVLMEKTFKHKC